MTICDLDDRVDAEKVGKEPAEFFIPFPTPLRTIRCIGSVSATPVCTSAADDHDATPADEFEHPGPPSGKAIIAHLHIYPLVSLIQLEKYLIWV
jgi:hypothetical protein